MECEIVLKSGQILSMDGILGCAYNLEDDRVDFYYDDGVVDGYPRSEIGVIRFYA